MKNIWNHQPSGGLLLLLEEIRGNWLADMENFPVFQKKYIQVMQDFFHHSILKHFNIQGFFLFKQKTILPYFDENSVSKL